MKGCENLPESFTGKAKNALAHAQKLASELGHTYIGSEHLLLALALETESVACRLLESRGISGEKLKRAIIDRVGKGDPTKLRADDMTPRVRIVIENSAAWSARTNTSGIGTEHLLLALLSEPDCVAVTLVEEAGADPDELIADAERFIGSVVDRPERRPPKAATITKLRDAPSLAQYGRDLTAAARDHKLDPVIGREDETERLIGILSRRTKNNPCLIGEPGVGKTAVVEGLALRIAAGNVPDTLAGRTIITLDIPSMIAGAKYRGEFEERMKAVMAETARNPSVILFVDELHTIIGAGAAEGAVDAANILKPALARGEIQIIGATTTEEFRAKIEKDSALERRFQSVVVGEPSPEEALQILRGLKSRYESHHKITITDEAIDAAVRLSVRYLGDRYLPDKAIDLIDEAASKKHISSADPPELLKEEEKLRAVTSDKENAIRAQDFEKAARLRDTEHKLKREISEKRLCLPSSRQSIGEEEIADVVTAWTGIPVKKLASEENEKLKNLAEVLKSRVIGQDEAVEAVAAAIKRGRIGLRDPNRPIGSFLFLGPTGVGKTELAKALAENLFGSDDAMIRFDMSEFMEKHSASKLIGSPPGYVGYGDGGQLTGRIRRKPYSVVLFDEIEKAHPDVFDLLLQILEDGILTDSEGRRANFSNSVVIMTSNVGARSIIEPKRLGFTPSGGATVNDALRETFKPEFLNRIDEIITFQRLSPESTAKIARVMLGIVTSRVRALGYDVELSPDVAEKLGAEGSDEKNGARPLRRLITRKVEDSFAAALLSGGINPGDRLLLTFENGQAAWKKLENQP